MQREIVGRTKEQKTMRRLLDSKKSEFLVMYGRRRVGKTFLIREFYKEDTIFHCSGINTANAEDQLEVFYDSLLAAGLVPMGKPTNWIQAFNGLKQVVNQNKSKKKKVIFLDEISWLETPRSNFIAALSHFWNVYCESRTDIILVGCGSVSTWLQDNIIENTGELHNRSNAKILLQPFSLFEVEQYLKHNNVKLVRKDIATLYMITGGIPYYICLLYTSPSPRD